MLEQAIYRTLIYFDVQDHPLTLIELGKYLLEVDLVDRDNQTPQASDFQTAPASDSTHRNYSLSEILQALERGMRAGKIDTHLGFYFLKNRKELAIRRWQNNFYSDRRLRRAREFLSFARHIPFISGLALSGSEAIASSRQGSDIDLLILTRKNRLWLARFFLTAYFQILGMRRHGRLIVDRFCLNHYIEQGKVLDYDLNIYTALLYAALIPYVGAGSILDFQARNAGWIKKYLGQPIFMEYETPPASAIKGILENFFSLPIFDIFESMAKKYQRHRINLEEFITVQDNELSLHPGSKGQQILSAFQKRLRQSRESVPYSLY